MNEGLGLLGLLALYGFVAFGSTIPVVPTGPAVSAAAVLAAGEHTWEIAVVVAVGAAGAYTGDITTYGALRIAGESLAQRVGWLQRTDPRGALQRIRARIEAHELRALLVSRLLPGGRVPVLLAASLGGYPWQRFVVAAIASTLLWSCAYTTIGLLGDSLFEDPQLAVIAAVVGAVLLTVVVQATQRWWIARQAA
ncbi:DedA family protein [Aeromicrobium sp. CTD01-1L150]|uniref:DedA family protein n=1 Tax=Aeromicrobium sp. CTD01-1L150 TaxID=3341830 RepID=UPI0035BF366B